MLLSMFSAIVLLTGSLLPGCTCRSDVNVIPEKQPFQNDHGRWLSMGVTSEGAVVAAYYDRTKSGLGMATGNLDEQGEMQWKHERVDGYPDSSGLDASDRGSFASLAVAPDDSIWIAYYDATNGSLRIAHRVDGSWQLDLADGGSGSRPNVGHWASLALDSQGQPVVAHYDVKKGTLRRAALNGDSWSAQTIWEGEPFSGTDAEGLPVSRDASVGMFARLVIQDDKEFIAFYDAAQQDLHLLEGVLGDYQHTLVAQDGNVGQWPSLLVEEQEVLIAYHDVSQQNLMLAQRFDDSAFQNWLVDDGALVGADSELFRRGDDVQLAYFDGENNAFRTANIVEGEWQVVTHETSGSALGFHNEVVFMDEKWWLGCYDYTLRRLHFRQLF